ncbi:MAG: TorD/DmsD family molecular chaperone [Desulfocapsaceae bacterium]
MESSSKEIIIIRLRLIDLIKSFFIDKPDAELLSRWRGTFSALTKEQISPLLDKAVRDVSQQLGEKSLEAIQDEYYSLFVDPFGENHVNLIASHYFDGRNYGETLVSIRDVFLTSKVVKEEEVKDPEDSLVVMFDLLGTLIEMEKDGDQTSTAQQQLIVDYLVPFMEKLRPAISNNSSADFYVAVVGFVVGYLDLEKGLSDYSD